MCVTRDRAGELKADQGKLWAPSAVRRCWGIWAVACIRKGQRLSPPLSRRHGTGCRFITPGPSDRGLLVVTVRNSVREVMILFSQIIIISQRKKTFSLHIILLLQFVMAWSPKNLSTNFSQGHGRRRTDEEEENEDKTFLYGCSDGMFV